MIEVFSGWKRNSVWLMTGPEPAGGCRTAAVWAAGVAGAAGAAGACPKTAVGARNRPKRTNILEFTEYKPVGRWLNNP